MTEKVAGKKPAMEVPSFKERLSDFRYGVKNCDWEPDGVNTNQGWTFLSESKIKSQINPLLAVNKLEWSVKYQNLMVLEAVGSMKQHYVVDCHVTIFDVYSDEKVEYSAFGEGADSGDKAISKAQTNALKNVIANNFLLSSYNAESEGMIESTVSKRSGMSFTDAKKEAKEILVESSAKPVVAPARPVEAKETAVPTATQKTLINAIQKNAMEKIMTKAKTATEESLAPFGGLAVIEGEYNSVKESNDAKQATFFIQRYKVI